MYEVSGDGQWGVDFPKKDPGIRDVVDNAELLVCQSGDGFGDSRGSDSYLLTSKVENVPYVPSNSIVEV
jgi:hypothetical protein